MPRKSRKEASNPLLWIQRLVRRHDYELSLKVWNNVSNGNCALKDIEHSITNGFLTKTMKDEKGESIDGKKYVICGPAFCGLGFETSGKLIKDNDSEIYFIITAYGRI